MYVSKKNKVQVARGPEATACGVRVSDDHFADNKIRKRAEFKERKKVYADCKNFRIIGFSLIIGSEIVNYFQFDGFIIILLRCNMSLTWPDVVNTCNVDKIDALRNCFMYKRFLELQYVQWFERYVQDYIDISAVMLHLIQAVADSCVLMLRLCALLDILTVFVRCCLYLDVCWRFVPAARV